MNECLQCVMHQRACVGGLATLLSLGNQIVVDHDCYQIQQALPMP